MHTDLSSMRQRPILATFEAPLYPFANSSDVSYPITLITTLDLGMKGLISCLVLKIYACLGNACPANLTQIKDRDTNLVDPLLKTFLQPFHF